MSERATGWAKLDLDIEQLVEPVAIETGVGPVAIAYWVSLLIAAKSGERFGFVETTAKRFARRVFETRARPTLWQAFADEGLIELVEGSFDGRFVVKMHERFFEDQVAKPKSPAERAREYRKRHKPASESGERNGNRVTQGVRNVTTVTADVTGKSDHRLETVDKPLAPNGALPKSRSPRIAALSADQVEQRIETCRQTLNGLSPFVEQLVDAMAEENRTGKVSASRVLRELWLPITALTEEVDRSALRHGLEAAVRAGAPNVRYVKKAAAGYRPARGGDIIDIEANRNGNGNGRYSRPDHEW